MDGRRRPHPPGNEAAKTALAAAGIAAFAVACCAGGPLLVAVASGLALGTVLGAGVGVLALVALVALVVLRARLRRVCTPTSSTTRKGGPA